MAKFNQRGQLAMGVGCGLVSVGGKVIARGGGTCWLDATKVIYQRMEPTPDGEVCFIDSYDVETGLYRHVVAERGANVIVAGGGRWQAWLGGYGAFGTAVGHLPDASVLDATQDGVFAIKTVYQSNRGVDLYSEGLPPVHLDVPVPRGVSIVSPSAVMWGDGGPIDTSDGQPKQPPFKFWSPVPVVVQGKRFIVAWCDEYGLIAFDDSLNGHVISKAEAFNHDAVEVDGFLFVGYSTTQGERPEDGRIAIFDVTRLSMDFHKAPPRPEPEPEPQTPPVTPPVTPEVPKPPEVPPTPPVTPDKPADKPADKPKLDVLSVGRILLRVFQAFLKEFKK